MLFLRHLCAVCAGFQFATNNIEEGIGAAKMAQEAGVLQTNDSQTFN